MGLNLSVLSCRKFFCGGRGALLSVSSVVYLRHYVLHRNHRNGSRQQCSTEQNFCHVWIKLKIRNYWESTHNYVYGARGSNMCRLKSVIFRPGTRESQKGRKVGAPTLLRSHSTSGPTLSPPNLKLVNWSSCQILRVLEQFEASDLTSILTGMVS